MIESSDKKATADLRISLRSSDIYECIKNSEFITDSTKAVYFFSLKRIEKYTKKDINTAIDNPAETFVVLEKSILNRLSLKTTIASILAVLKHSNMKKTHKKLFEKWYKIYIPLLKEANEDRLNNIASSRQLKSNIKWESVLNTFSILLKKDPSSRECLLLGFYVILKPRRQEDYFQVYIYSKKSKEQINKELPAYIDLKTNMIVINLFKTSKSMPPFKKTLPAELLGLLSISLKKDPRKYLFTQNNGEMFSNRNSFTQYSNRILKKTLVHNTTVNTLRHAYSSYRNKLGLTLKERKNDSYDMGHTLETHLSYAVDTNNDPKHTFVDNKPVPKDLDAFTIEQNKKIYNCSLNKSKSPGMFKVKKNNKTYTCVS